MALARIENLPVRRAHPIARAARLELEQDGDKKSAKLDVTGEKPVLSETPPDY